MGFLKKLINKYLLSWTPSFNSRFGIVLGVLLLYVLAIILCATKTFVIDRPHYEILVKNLKRDSVSIPQICGMIYSETGDMIAASAPEYDIFFDFRNKDQEWYKTITDTVKKKKIRITV